MKHLRSLAADIVRWAKNEPSVDAVLWYGSVGRGDSTPASDLDTVVLHAASAQPREVLGSLRQFLGDRVRFVSCAAGRPEATVWIDASLVKIDLHFGTDPEQFAWLADSPDVPAPRLVTALDKSGRSRPLVERAAALLPRDPASLVNDEIEKFLTGFEAASAAHRRSDGYQFYFHYNLALHRLARLMELCRGNPVYLFLPKMLLSRLMPSPEQQRWRSLRGTLYLPEANAAKRQLAETFLAVFEELSRRCALSRSPDEVRSFLDAVIHRDLFFNVRDFADAFDGLVRRGRLFRASTLTRWQDEPALRRWLADQNIRTIIDFRHPDEMVEPRARYPADLLGPIRYVNLPLSGPPGQGAAPPPAELGRSYMALLLEHLPSVVEALRVIAADANEATVVHCHAGKDRTGFFCAVLAMLLGLPRDRIHDDYVLSGQGVLEIAIAEFADAVEREGGVVTLLSRGGLGDDTVAALSNGLLMRER